MALVGGVIFSVNVQGQNELLEKVLNRAVIWGLIDCKPILKSTHFASGESIQEFVALDWVIIRLDESRQVSANRSRMARLSTETQSASVGVKSVIWLSTKGVGDKNPSFWDDSPTIVGMFLFGFPTLLSLLVPFLSFLVGKMDLNVIAVRKTRVQFPNPCLLTHYSHTPKFLQKFFVCGRCGSVGARDNLHVPAAHWWLSGNVKLGLIWGSVVD